MRIVVWNCGTRLRGKKLNALENLQPDIAIVLDCESPQKLWDKQPLLAPIPMEWVGENEQKGLGVLAFNGYRIKRHADYDPSLSWILPVEVRGPVSFRLLAVWAANPTVSPAEGDGPSGQPLEALSRYRAFLAAGPTAVAGEFHAMDRMDQGKKSANSAFTAAALERLGMASAYHVARGEFHGKETLATFHRRDRKSTTSKDHVDYCFLPLEWCSHLREVEVGKSDAWVGAGLGWHVPLIVDVDVPATSRGKPPKPGNAIRTDLDA